VEALFEAEAVAHHFAALGHGDFSALFYFIGGRTGKGIETERASHHFDPSGLGYRTDGALRPAELGGELLAGHPTIGSQNSDQLIYLARGGIGGQKF
jgi:hypothetical protein